MTTPITKNLTPAQLAAYKMKWSPIFFIEKMWNLVPQPLTCVTPECEHTIKCFGQFLKGKHITWQQYIVLKDMERSLARGNKHIRISVRSGNGIGKDTLLSWLIHWFLFTHAQSQVGCTAPTTSQMYDVLWKELSIWHQKLPKGFKERFEWTTTHFRIKESPDSWWARARTGRKETPEALSGVHGKWVMLLGDEASGIPDEIFDSGEASLTGENTTVILVGNPVRLEGYFYDSHNKNKKFWKTYMFNGEESPIVSQEHIKEIVDKYSKDSDEYRYMILGEFPKADAIDKGGWMPLLNETDLKFVSENNLWRNPKMGIDPAGEGTNKTSHVIRDAFFARVISLEEISSNKSIVERTLTLQTQYNVVMRNCVIDNFGKGANVGMELALTGERPEAINVGEEAKDKERFYNLRAELYWLLREWIIAGGQLVKHPQWKELLQIKYKRTLTGKIQIMSKVEMKDRYGYESPDCADALSLSFYGDNIHWGNPYEEVREVENVRRGVLATNTADSGL